MMKKFTNDCSCYCEKHNTDCNTGNLSFQYNLPVKGQGNTWEQGNLRYNQKNLFTGCCRCVKGDKGDKGNKGDKGAAGSQLGLTPLAISQFYFTLGAGQIAVLPLSPVLFPLALITNGLVTPSVNGSIFTILQAGLYSISFRVPTLALPNEGPGEGPPITSTQLNLRINGVDNFNTVVGPSGLNLSLSGTDFPYIELSQTTILQLGTNTTVQVVNSSSTKSFNIPSSANLSGDKPDTGYMIIQQLSTVIPQ